VLFFLAPAIAELLSGSSPPSEFFNPIAFALLASLYGSGALIVRELKVRWNKGYVSMFILGAAYGIIEEGLMVKSFFDPEWMDLGILGVYGRWQGVNWVWAEWLTLYHAIFSVAIPITLVELAYFERRNESWVGNKTLGVLVILLGAVTALGYSGLTPYKPPATLYLLSIAVVIIFILFAWKIPSKTGKNGMRRSKPRRFALVGFLATSALFLLFMLGPHVIPQPSILMALGVVLTFVMFGFFKRYEWNEKTLRQKIALVSGALSFLIILTPLYELDKSRQDNPQGMLIVGIIALVLLLLLNRRLQFYVKEKGCFSPQKL
jgi:peptidoglycan/LPS O-acetylase OafA/YrhL